MSDDPATPPPATPPSAPGATPEAAPDAPSATPSTPAPTVTITAPPPPAGPNPVAVAWGDLDPTSRWIIGASIGLLAALVLGAIVGAWYATGTFAIFLIVAAIAAGGAAWYTSASNAGPKPTKLPLVTVEFAAGLVAATLTGLRVLEMLFDWDDLGDYGGLVGVVITLAAAIAGWAILFGAFRRDPSLRSPRAAGDTGTRLALSGFALVVIGWVLNLTIGFWTTSGAATAVGLAALATAVIIVAPRWSATVPELPVAWVGAALAVVALLVGIGLWGDLQELGSTRIELGILDFVGFLLFLIGVVLVVVGGLLAGRPWLETRPKRAPASATADTPGQVGAAAAPADDGAAPSTTTPPSSDADDRPPQS